MIELKAVGALPAAFLLEIRMSEFTGPRVHVEGVLSKDGKMIRVGAGFRAINVETQICSIVWQGHRDFISGDVVKFKTSCNWNDYEWKVIGTFEDEIYVKSSYGKVVVVREEEIILA